MSRVSAFLARRASVLAVALGFAAVLLLDLPAGPPEALAKRKPKQASSEKNAKDAATPSSGEKPFGDVVKDAKKSEGCFTVYRSKDHLYVEVPDRAADTDYCLSAQVVGAIGDWSARGS